MLYLSLDLRVSDWDPASRSALVEVLRSPVGEVPPQRLPLGLDPQGQGDRVLYDEHNAQRLGQALWESVFCGGIGDAWKRSYQRATDRRRGLRLRIHTDDARLLPLPWELLYDPAKQEYLVYDRHVSMVRYARIPSPQPEAVVAGQLTVLVVAASPTDHEPLDWQREISLLRASLKELIDQQRIRLVVCEHATVQSLQDRLIEAMPEVVHYVGHGTYDEATQTGALLLENRHGSAAPLEAHAVARLFCRYRTQLVFLNACDTARGQTMGLAAALMRGDMPAVVAMQWPVQDEAAMHFGRAFYRAISLDLTIDECMSEGRLAVSTAGGEPADWAAPVLYMRSLSGSLWVPVPAQARTSIEATALAVKGGAVAAELNGAAVVGSAHGVTATPFLTGRPLRAQKDDAFLLRREELARILKIARQPAVAQYIAVLGSQYSGKTTLLLQVQNALQAEQACAYCDLAPLAQADLTQCLRAIAKCVGSQLAAVLATRRGTLVRRNGGTALYQATPISEVLATHPLKHISTAADLILFLERLAAAYPGPRITVLLDQLDRLSDQVSDSLWATLRSILVQARRSAEPLSKYLFILAGSLDLQAALGQRQSPWNVVERIYLGDLDTLQIASILAQFTRQGVTVSEDAPRLVREATGGHPYLTMRLCSWLQRLQVRVVDAPAIQAGVANMLVADEHLRETVRRVAANPAADATLRRILAGEQLRFTRSDPAMAALELLGVIAPSTPVRLRSALYERVLRAYALEHPAPPITARAR